MIGNIANIAVYPDYACKGTAIPFSPTLDNCIPPNSYACKSYSKVTVISASASPSPAGTLLTGYFSNIHYYDSTCSVVRDAQKYKLNTCFPMPEGFSGRVIMNATHWNANYYSDYSCTVLYTTTLVYYPLRTCDNFETASVTSSYSKIVSSADLLDVMYVTQFPFKYEIFTTS